MHLLSKLIEYHQHAGFRCSANIIPKDCSGAVKMSFGKCVDCPRLGAQRMSRGIDLGAHTSFADGARSCILGGINDQEVTRWSKRSKSRASAILAACVPDQKPIHNRWLPVFGVGTPPGAPVGRVTYES